MARLSATRVAIALALAGLLIVVAVQLISPPSPARGAGSAETGALGRAGFAYLTGLRTFAAAVLWNRLDPIMDKYEPGGLSHAQYMLPSIQLVTWLDPKFEQAYYVGQWIIARHGGTLAEAKAMTRDGIAANPRSGLLLASYAQLLQGASKTTVPSAYEWAKKAIEPGVTWHTVEDEYDEYGVLRVIFEIAHDPARVKFVKEVQKRLQPLKATDPAPPNPGFQPVP